jgi:hypothetical protein
MNKNTPKTENEIIREMLPFFLYAAIPILITVTIAYTFGTR